MSAVSVNELLTADVYFTDSAESRSLGTPANLSGQGEAETIAEIADADSGHSYYPVPVSRSSLPFSPCLTLSRPSEDYREDTLFDMEARY